MSNVLEEGQILQVIRLKSGEHLIGIVTRIDKDYYYLHAPALINIKDNSLSDFMFTSTALGTCLSYKDTYFIEQPSEEISVLYAEYFIDITIINEKLVI